MVLVGQVAVKYAVETAAPGLAALSQCAEQLRLGHQLRLESGWQDVIAMAFFDEAESSLKPAVATKGL